MPVQEVQDLVRAKLSQHEYPRHVAVVAELPKTPAGKVHRVYAARAGACSSRRRPSGGLFRFLSFTHSRVRSFIHFNRPISKETDMLTKVHQQRNFPKITDEGLDDLRSAASA